MTDPLGGGEVGICLLGKLEVDALHFRHAQSH